MFDLITLLYAIGGFFLVFFVGFVLVLPRWYKKATAGQALVRIGGLGKNKKDENGREKRKIKVSFDSMWVIPVIHKLEIMDISLKSFTLERMGKEGLICKDNMRADIKVTFFISVNSTEDDVKHVAMSIGTARASDRELLINLFDAKFSEALKTVGKKFDFTQLYSERDEFKKAMITEIGTEMNGYSLDSAAIDYLEQTKLEHLDPENILDAEGITKITQLTAEQHKFTNKLKRDEEKVITQQNVEAKETILDLNKQLAEKEENQKRDIAAIKARAEAETLKIQQEELLKSEKARLATEEELQINEEKKQREVIIERKRKEAIEARQIEIVDKERQLEMTEKEKVVELAQIAKLKEVEIQKRDIQGVIKSRIELEKETVLEEEKIKDTRAYAEAERQKKVAITQAEQLAEEALVQEIKAAEAKRKAAELKAEQDKLEATVEREVADKKAESKKIMAEAVAEEAAALGLSEAKVLEAKSAALQKQGQAEANVIKQKALAEADGITAKKAAENAAYEEQGKIDARVLEEKGFSEAKVIDMKADSIKKQGLAEAEVMAKKAEAEALKISAKAEAMKKLDGVGKEHEEFKLKLEQETQLALAKINIQKEISQAQSLAIAEALKASHINIVGGETMFYENIMNAVTRAKVFDSIIDNSNALTSLKDVVLNGNGNGEGKHALVERLKGFVGQFGLKSDDVKNLTVSALIFKLLALTKDDGIKGTLNSLLTTAQQSGLLDKNAANLLT